MRFFHTDDGPLEHEIERVETVMDKGLVINWHVSCSFCTNYIIILIVANYMISELFHRVDN